MNFCRLLWQCHNQTMQHREAHTSCADINSISNDVLCDIVHRLYCGVLFLWNVLWFCGTCIIVILCGAMRNVQPSLHHYSWKLTNMGLHYLHISSTQFHPNWPINMGSMVWNSLTALSKCGLNCTVFQKMREHSVHFCLHLMYYLFSTSGVDSKFKISVVHSQLLNIISIYTALHPNRQRSLKNTGRIISCS